MEAKDFPTLGNQSPNQSLPAAKSPVQPASVESSETPSLPPLGKFSPILKIEKPLAASSKDPRAVQARVTFNFARSRERLLDFLLDSFFLYLTFV